MAKVSSTEIITFDSIKKDPLHYAETFSEGCNSLKELLFYCFNNDIRTIACCRGHKDSSSCYIYFAIKEQDFLYYKAVINDLVTRYDAGYEIRPNINFMEYQNYYGLILRGRTIDANRFFFSILTDLKYHDKMDYYPNVDDYLSIINYFKKNKIAIDDSMLCYESKCYKIKLFNKYYSFNGYLIPLDQPDCYLNSIQEFDSLEILKGKYIFESGTLHNFYNNVLKKILK